MQLAAAQARERFVAARVARLATVGNDGQPHLVPITFAVAGDVLYSAVDAKPKSGRRLQRLANIAANPQVCVLVDYYDDDWTRLWWARADGRARVLDAGAAPKAVDLLTRRYSVYVSEPPPGPVLAIEVGCWSGWASAG